MFTCARCRADLRKVGSTMSRFNIDWICGDCEDRERAHPKYREAHDAELRSVQAGVYNFPGIGCPPELYCPEKPKGRHP